MHFFEIVLFFIYGLCFISDIRGKSLSSESDGAIEGYYWRHYDVKVPSDALLGGTDVAGNPTYIGQAVQNGILIPGQIDQEKQQISFEWGNREHTAKKNIKILCTQQPEQFEWIRTSNEHFQNLQNDTFIYGGFESNYTIFIGRAFVGDELVIGKVLIINGDCKGLHTSNNGTFIRKKYFEILNYNPEIPTIDKIRQSLYERNLYEPNSASILECYFFSFVTMVTVLLLM